MPKQRSKRSRKSFEHYRRRRVADLRHMYRCCSHGVLPKANCAYLREVLAAENDLPSPEVIAERTRFTNAERERHRLWTIPPIDMSNEQLVEQRKRKDRERKVIARRKAGTQLREAYLAKFQKPWIAEGISRRTWYRRKANNGTRSCAAHEDGGTRPSGQQNRGRGTRSSEQQNGGGTRLSAPIYNNNGTTRATHHPIPPLQEGLQESVCSTVRATATDPVTATATQLSTALDERLKKPWSKPAVADGGPRHFKRLRSGGRWNRGKKPRPEPGKRL